MNEVWIVEDVRTGNIELEAYDSAEKAFEAFTGIIDPAFRGHYKLQEFKETGFYRCFALAVKRLEVK